MWKPQAFAFNSRRVLLYAKGVVPIPTPPTHKWAHTNTIGKKEKSCPLLILGDSINDYVLDLYIHNIKCCQLFFMNFFYLNSSRHFINKDKEISASVGCASLVGLWMGCILLLPSLFWVSTFHHLLLSNPTERWQILLILVVLCILVSFGLSTVRLLSWSATSLGYNIFSYGVVSCFGMYSYSYMENSRQSILRGDFTSF